MKILALAFLALSACSSFAVMVTHAGDSLGLGPEWRNPLVPKVLDGDEDNILGSDGYLLYATSPNGTQAGIGGNDVWSFPSYASISTGATSKRYRGNAQIENPVAGGTYNGTLQSGIAYYQAGLGQRFHFLDINFSQTLSKPVRIGFFVVGYATSNVPSKFELISGATSLAYYPPVHSTGSQFDYMFFDISGITAGTQISLFVTSSTDPGSLNRNPEIAGVTFDSVVPEPSTLVATAIATIMGYCRTRRRTTHK